MKRTAIFFSISAGPAFADPGDYGHMMDWGFGFMFGPVLWLIVLGLIVAGVIWLVRSTDQSRTVHGPHHASTPANGDAEALAILKMRFAKGEIDEEEYASRKKLLTG